MLRKTRKQNRYGVLMRMIAEVNAACGGWVTARLRSHAEVAF